jgi:hypothetical protein
MSHATTYWSLKINGNMPHMPYVSARVETYISTLSNTKGSLLFGDKNYNKLTLEIKNVAGNQKKFKTTLKQFLYNYSFYTIEKYFNQ